MKILAIGDNLSSYIAKCHEAFKTGLSRRLGATLYGSGYSNFNPEVKTCSDLFDYLGFEPDVIFVQDKPVVSGLKNFRGKKVSLIGDYWSVNQGEFEKRNRENGIGVTMVYFRQALTMLPGVSAKKIWIPACYDPEIFKDWTQQKSYDVGFLAAGISSPCSFYPERMAIHLQLKVSSGIRYMHEGHPGWGFFPEDHKLVGKGFSRAINRCKVFVTTSGRMRTMNSKYFEAIASGAVLAATSAEGMEENGFRAGRTYLQLDGDNGSAKRIQDLLGNEEKYLRIRMEAAEMIERHSCENRAEDFYREISK